MKSSSNDQIFDLMDALRSPVITHSLSWADTIPKRLLEIITTARLAKLYKHEEEASDPECVAFLYTACLEFPLSGEWVDIYTHLSCKIAQEYWQEDHWEAIQAPKVLNDYLIKEELKKLRMHIYDKRRKALKERMKSEKVKDITTDEINHPLIPKLIECEQLTLF